VSRNTVRTFEEFLQMTYDLDLGFILSFLWPALCNRAVGRAIYIFILSFVLLSSFFLRLISAVADWMSTILPHMVWP